MNLFYASARCFFLERARENLIFLRLGMFPSFIFFKHYFKQQVKYQNKKLKSFGSGSGGEPFSKGSPPEKTMSWKKPAKSCNYDKITSNLFHNAQNLFAHLTQPLLKMSLRQ